MWVYKRTAVNKLYLRLNQKYFTTGLYYFCLQSKIRPLNQKREGHVLANDGYVRYVGYRYGEFKYVCGVVNEYQTILLEQYIL